MKITLASTSVARRQQLAQLGVTFECTNPDIDETVLPNETAFDLVKRLSLEKAQKVASQHAEHIIIAGDLIGVLDENIIGKPPTFENAVQQLLNSSGKTLTFYSGVCVLNSATKKYDVAVELTHVTFRQLSQYDIETFVQRTQPLNCAGSFNIEGLGIALFEKIVSNDPSALLGLPLIQTVSLLKKHDISVFRENT